MGMVELDQSSCALNSGSHQLVSASECPRFLESRLTGHTAYTGTAPHSARDMDRS